MWRLAALALVLAAGCASTERSVLLDGVWGDFAERFSSTPRYAPTSPVSTPAFYPDTANKPAPAK